jgi:hypothetical protein
MISARSCCSPKVFSYQSRWGRCIKVGLTSRKKMLSGHDLWEGRGGSEVTVLMFCLDNLQKLLTCSGYISIIFGSLVGVSPGCPIFHGKCYQQVQREQVLPFPVTSRNPWRDSTQCGSRVSLHNSSVSLPGSKVSIMGSRVSQLGPKESLHVFRVNLRGSRVSLDGSRLNLTRSKINSLLSG